MKAKARPTGTNRQVRQARVGRAKGSMIRPPHSTRQNAMANGDMGGSWALKPITPVVSVVMTRVKAPDRLHKTAAATNKSRARVTCAFFPIIAPCMHSSGWNH